MVRIKVVRASRLLLCAAVVLLAVVLCLIGFRLFAGDGSVAVSPTADLVNAEANDEAKTETVFASNRVETPSDLPLVPAGALEIEIIPEAAADTEAPSVLIYHTHTHEAYEQVKEDPYDALEAWRTSDADHSVVRVGSELQRCLEGYGFTVVHDVTDHEGNALSTAYDRSLQTLQGYDRGFDLYIDLHRDAWADGMESTVANAAGEPCAQLMMLIGNGNGFDEKPYYRQNYAFAQALEQRVNRICPGLCKPVLVKDGRYNQHIGVFSILVEVGHNHNTLREALNAVPALAAGIDSLMISQPDPQLERMRSEYQSRPRG